MPKKIESQIVIYYEKKRGYSPGRAKVTAYRIMNARGLLKRRRPKRINK